MRTEIYLFFPFFLRLVFYIPSPQHLRTTALVRLELKLDQL